MGPALCHTSRASRNYDIIIRIIPQTMKPVYSIVYNIIMVQYIIAIKIKLMIAYNAMYTLYVSSQYSVYISERGGFHI